VKERSEELPYTRDGVRLRFPYYFSDLSRYEICDGQSTHDTGQEYWPSFAWLCFPTPFPDSEFFLNVFFGKRPPVRVSKVIY